MRALGKAAARGRSLTIDASCTGGFAGAPKRSRQTFIWLIALGCFRFGRESGERANISPSSRRAKQKAWLFISVCDALYDSNRLPFLPWHLLLLLLLLVLLLVTNKPRRISLATECLFAVAAPTQQRQKRQKLLQSISDSFVQSINVAFKTTTR